MSQILIRISYDNAQPYGERTGTDFGTTYDVTYWNFDTDALAVTTSAAGTYDNFQDASYPEAFNYDGEFYHYCAGTTRRGYVPDNIGGFQLFEEENSLSCGYTPPAPLTCDLGAASVSQVATANGATLTAAYAGAFHGRVLYRLDNRPEQLSPVFYSVLPGQHTVTLRDDGLSGCQRVVTVTVAAPAAPAAPTGPSTGLDLVGQPVWYVPAPVPPGAQVQLELWVESAHGAGDYALVMRLRKSPNAQGQLRFRLDTLLWPLLRAFVPVPAVKSSLCTGQLRNYFVRTTTLRPGQPPVYATSAVRTALRGALPAEWTGGTYAEWQAYEFRQLPFLSWQPLGAGTYANAQPKPVTAQQPEWLFFLCPADLADESLQVRRSAGPALDTLPTESVELLKVPAGGWAYRLLAIPLRLLGGTYQRVQVETRAGTVLSQPAWYQLVAATERSRYLVFTNSLGGLDTLRCEGRLEQSLEASTESTEQLPQLGPRAPAAERRVSDVLASRKLRLQTGWLSNEELDWLQELVLAREVWQQLGSQLRSLDWPKRSLATYSDEPGLRGLLLECDYAYAPTAYAPGRHA